MTRKIGHAIVWSTIGTWGTQAISLCFFLFLSRALGPKLYGLAAVSTLFLTVSQALITDGFSQIILRAQRVEEDLINLVFWLQLGFGASFSALIVGFAGFAGRYFHDPIIEPLMWLSSTIPLMQSLQSVPIELTKRDLRFQRLAVRGFASAMTAGAVGVALALLGFGVWALIIMQVVQVLVQGVVIWAGVGWRPSLAVTRQAFRRHAGMLRYGALALLGRVLNLFDSQIPKFAISIGFGVLIAAYYNFGMRLTEVVAIISLIPVQQVSGAIFSRYQDHPEEMAESVLTLLRAASILTLPALAGMYIVAPNVVPLLFGLKWISAVPYLRTILVLLLVAPLNYVVTDLVIITGHLGARRLTHGVSILSGLAIVALLPLLGSLGAAWAFALRSIAMTPLLLWAANRASKVSYLQLLAALMPSMVATLAMALACEAFTLLVDEPLPVLKLIEQVAVSLFVYFGVQQLLFRRELSMMLGLIDLRRKTAPA